MTNSSSDKAPRSYPLCKTGWCLERLRATCELWHFVRTGIIHVIWNADDEYVLPPETAQNTPGGGDQLEAAPAVVRRKSGWGLGFELADKTGSGGWTKAFKGSASTPGSPAVEKASLAEDSVVEEEKPEDDLEKREELSEGPVLEKKSKVVENGLKVEEGLGAPLELNDEKSNGNGDVPTIHEPERSPISPTSNTVQESPSQPEQEDALQAPKLHRGDSTDSVNGTDDGNFSIPKGTNLDLPDDTTAPSSSIDGPTPEVVDLSSPNPMPISPSKAGKLNLPLPPIPRRAAARNRASQIDGAEFSSSSLERLGVSPTESEGDNPPTPAETISTDITTDQSLAQGESTIDEAVDPAIEDKAEEAPGARRSSLPPRPPLPPRHPKTPTAQVANTLSEGQKTFLSGDGWEVRTWKQVIRLKEEMWKARVGVMDS